MDPWQPRLSPMPSGQPSCPVARRQPRALARCQAVDVVQRGQHQVGTVQPAAAVQCHQVRVGQRGQSLAVDRVEAGQPA